jgi:hypothetical protein
MTHRAEQIIDAVVSRLQAATAALGIAPANIQAHRTLSLADVQGELPFVGVNFGEDNPAEEYNELGGEIGSALEVLTTTYVTGEDEPAVKRALLAARTESHKAINPDVTLGLAFVLKVEYGGAAAPDINTDGESCAGSQECRWLVTYHMNPSDPS